jgi:two-component system, LytTR family, response regulator
MTAPSSSRLRVVLVDDEPLVRLGLRRLLEQEPDVELVAECADGDQAVTAVKEHRPDVLLLDMQMPGRTGLEVLVSLGEERPRAVVFVTAHDTYAIDAFEQHAVDYLLKPFDQRRFRVALGRVRERLGAGTSDDRLDRLLKALAPRTEWLERIPAKVGNRVTLVPVGEIHWIEAADNYVRLHTGDGQYAVRETMNNLAEQLDPRQFARVHRSTIVNLSRVKSLLALPSGDYTVVLEGGTRLTLSRGYRKGFEEQIGRTLG